MIGTCSLLKASAGEFHSETARPCHPMAVLDRSGVARTQRLATSPTAAARIAEHIDQLNEVIDEIRAAVFDPDADAVEIPLLGGVGLPRPGRWTSRRPRPLRCDGGSAPVHAHGRSPTPARRACRPAGGDCRAARARLRLADVTRSIRYRGRCDGPGSLSLAAVVPTAFDVVRAWVCPFRRGQGRGHRRGSLSVA